MGSSGGHILNLKEKRTSFQRGLCFDATQGSRLLIRPPLPTETENPRHSAHRGQITETPTIGELNSSMKAERAQSTKQTYRIEVCMCDGWNYASTTLRTLSKSEAHGAMLALQCFYGNFRQYRSVCEQNGEAIEYTTPRELKF